MAAIRRDNPMGIAKKCRLAGVSRMAAYRPAAKQASSADLALMRRIDEPHTAHPFHGARQIMAALRLDGERTGRNRVRRLMRIMGVSAVAPKPQTSVKAPSPRVFPYLLKDVAVTEPDQAWCADITCIPRRDGLGHPLRALVAAVQQHGRWVFAWMRSTPPCGAARRPASSTRTKVRSSPARPSRRLSWGPGRGFRWTGAAAGWTTASSSGFGGRSNARRFTFMRWRMDLRPVG